MNLVRHILKPAHLILYGSSVFIGLSFVLYYIIDLKNYWGARDWLFSTEGVYFYFTYTPFFFQHYGRDGGFAEIVQWGLLAVAVLLALFYAGKLFDTNRLVAKFWLIFGVGMMLMLLEDAGEMRHLFMSYIQWAAGEPDQGLVGTLFEGVYFVILGGLPVYAFIRYREEIRTHGRVFWFVLLGILSHAMAASLSFIGTAFQMTIDTDIYSVMGDWFKFASLRLADPEVADLWNAWDAENWLYQVDFYLMDSFVEENIEILGNAFFLAAAVSVFALYTKGRQERWR
jgi:hypothetical protein